MLAEVKKKHPTLGFVYKTIQTDEFLEDFFLTKNQFSFLEGMRNL